MDKAGFFDSLQDSAHSSSHWAKYARNAGPEKRPSSYSNSSGYSKPPWREIHELATFLEELTAGPVSEAEELSDINLALVWSRVSGILRGRHLRQNSGQKVGPREHRVMSGR